MTRFLTNLALVLAVAVLSFAVGLLIGEATADAHAGTEARAESRVIDGNMKGHCGNGWLSYCLGETRHAFSWGRIDAHSYKVSGWWTERRFRHANGPGYRGPGMYECSAMFTSSPHGVGIVLDSERCYRVPGL